MNRFNREEMRVIFIGIAVKFLPFLLASAVRLTFAP